MAEVASLNINVRTNGTEKAISGLDSLSVSGNKAEKQTTLLSEKVVALNANLRKTEISTQMAAKSADRLSNGMRVQGYQVQNAAFQLQDIVTQLEMGTSVSRTLSQQLPQLLSAFGPIGAVIGLVSGLAFAIGGTLVNSIFDGTDAVNKLDEALENLDTTVAETEDGVSL